MKFNSIQNQRSAAREVKTTCQKVLQVSLYGAVLSLLVCFAECVGAAPVARAAKSWTQELAGYQSHVYKRIEGRELELFIISPAGHQSEQQRPAMVFFNGGGWVSGNPTQFKEHGKYLASRGMVAVLVEYRLLDKSSHEPPLVCVQDAKSAMRWVRGHATHLGIDPNRIAAGGGSAGGHLAAFVGMVEGLDDANDDLSITSLANALILFNPVFDNGPSGWGQKRVGDRYREFSPFHNVTQDDPPSIVFLGTEDKLIPVQTVKDFQAAMKEVGVRCEVHFYEGQPHGFFNQGRSGNRYYLLTMTETDQFLAALGWLQGKPTLPKP